MGRVPSKMGPARPCSANLTAGERTMAQRPVLDESSVALTFDDVLLVPRPSDVLPGETDVTSASPARFR